MADSRAKDLIDLGDKLFAKKDPLNSLMQEIAEIFYPQRATFTTEHYEGRDYASNILDAHALRVRDELGSALSAILRPRATPWAAAATLDDEVNAEPENAQYLEYLTNVTRTHMYHAPAQFVRATKEGDHDFITFGQTVIATTESPDRRHLFFRNHHLRDCAWLENAVGVIDHLHRKDRMTARTMMETFGEKKVHKTVKTAAEKEPGKEFSVRVIAMPSKEYDFTQSGNYGGKVKRKLPFNICYVDVDNCHMMREDADIIFPYVVPRWSTVSGSQYAYSPATWNALPDGRMAQQMARILLEAGEKSIDPPAIANSEMIREANIAAGALTWADVGPDGNLKDAYMPIPINGDMKTGFAMRADLRQMIEAAFKINKLSLPENTAGMTATEIRARLEEHVRNLLPLFEPMEQEYNNKLLDNSFARLKAMNKYDFMAMPDALSNANFIWSFKNPMQEASTRILVSQFQETLGTVQMGMEAGAKVSPIKVDVALQDAVRGAGGPAKWRKTAEEMGAELEAMVQQQTLEKAAAQASTVAGLGQQVGDAAQSLQAGGVIPPTPEQAQRGKPRVIQGGRAA